MLPNVQVSTRVSPHANYGGLRCTFARLTVARACAVDCNHAQGRAASQGLREFVPHRRTDAARECPRYFCSCPRLSLLWQQEQLQVAGLSSSLFPAPRESAPLRRSRPRLTALCQPAGLTLSRSPALPLSLPLPLSASCPRSLPLCASLSASPPPPISTPQPAAKQKHTVPQPGQSSTARPVRGGCCTGRHSQLVHLRLPGLVCIESCTALPDWQGCPVVSASHALSRTVLVRAPALLTR